MKKAFFIITFFLALSIYLSGQDVKSDSAKYVYCELIASQKPFGKELSMNIDINYGEGAEKTKEFTNTIAALNHMSVEGWEIIFVYVTTLTATPNYPDVHYILSKRK